MSTELVLEIVVALILGLGIGYWRGGADAIKDILDVFHKIDPAATERLTKEYVKECGLKLPWRI